MTAESKVTRSFGGNAVASTASGSIYQDPGVIDIAAARTAANGNGPLIITDLRGYIASYGTTLDNVRMKLSTAQTALFKPAGVSSSTDPSGDSGWRSCTTTLFVANGASNRVFGYYDMGSFGVVAARSSSGGTVVYQSLGERTGVLGGQYRFVQSPAAPAAPSLSRSGRTISASWIEPLDGASAVTGYDLQYSTSSTFASGVTTVSLGNVLTWSSTLSYGTLYYVRVAAKNAVTTAASTTSVYSTGSSVFTVPDTPTGFTVTSVSATTVALDWGGDTTGVQRYRVSYKRAADSTWIDSGYSGTTSAYTVTGLTQNTIYDFRVSAENTTYSASSNFATLSRATLPSTPTGLSVSAFTSTSVSLDWNDNPVGFTSYRVEFKVAADSTWTNTGYAGTTSAYTVTGLAFNTAYDFRVSTLNSSNSTQSGFATANQTTLPAGPPVRTSTTTWSPSEVYVCTDDDPEAWTLGAMYVCTSTSPVVWKVVG